MTIFIFMTKTKNCKSFCRRYLLEYLNSNGTAKIIVISSPRANLRRFERGLQKKRYVQMGKLKRNLSRFCANLSKVKCADISWPKGKY